MRTVDLFHRSDRWPFAQEPGRLWPLFLVCLKVDAVASEITSWWRHDGGEPRLLMFRLKHFVFAGTLSDFQCRAQQWPRLYRACLAVTAEHRKWRRLSAIYDPDRA